MVIYEIKGFSYSLRIFIPLNHVPVKADFGVVIRSSPRAVRFINSDQPMQLSASAGAMYKLAVHGLSKRRKAFISFYPGHKKSL